MELHPLSAKTRVSGGKKSDIRSLRVNGEIPAVMYGGGEDPVSLRVDEKEVIHLLHTRGGQHAIVELNFEDQPNLSHPALLKAVQHHPLRDKIMHLDFLRIRLDERITTSVDVVLTGRCVGVIEGGVLDHQLREVEIECLAVNVPTELKLDVSSLKMGESLHVSDLKYPNGVTLLTEPDRAIVAVHPPRVATSAAEEGEEGEEGEEA